jgi:2-haloacid dehalogenase
MRNRLVLPALLALTVSACAAPRHDAAPAVMAAPATTAVPTTQASSASTGPARRPPRGILPVARRRPAPALPGAAFDGRTVTLDDFRGRPVVVSFFESWCPVCRAEQPDLSQVARELAGRVGFVGVSYHDTVAAGRAYQRRFGVPYPLANDASGRTWGRWRVPYQPVTVVVDTQGRIAERFDGGTTGGPCAMPWSICSASDPASSQRHTEAMMRRVQVFDVNETLLDLAAMDPHFERVFGDVGMRQAWFTQMIQSALVATVTGVYSDFGAHAMAALEMTAETAGVELREEDRQAVARQLRGLPAHPEVLGALQRLHEAGLRLAALTNSTEQVAGAQLEDAGLIDVFELVLSADAVRRLKPAPEPYRMAAERLGVAVGEVRLIAAHAWDVAGAARAGCAAAFVARPDKVLDPLVERPDVVGADLGEVADCILAVDK